MRRANAGAGTCLSLAGRRVFVVGHWWEICVLQLRDNENGDVQAGLTNWRLIAITALAFLVTVSSCAQSQQWEELTAPDFVKAIQQAQATCLLPRAFWKSTTRIFRLATI